jgi:hydroxymethylpyrimidine/phosphomethylpyrimidine kinase
MTDIGADAVKIGMLHSPEVIAVVAQKLLRYGARNIVVDPVMVSKGGSRLLREQAVEALRRRLFPLARLITPNLPEASVLLGRAVEKEQDMREACRDLAGFGPRAVLLKGGHLGGGGSPDLLYAEGGKILLTLEGERIVTRNTHGTGCTLSSAVAAGLAKGLDIGAAARAAKDYISAAIRAGAAYDLGKGHGPVHHYYAFWE